MIHTRIRKILIFALALVLLPACFFARTEALAASAPLNLVDFFSEHSRLDLEPYRGKALFLNFFTEWCPYCMEEMPDIKQAFEAYSQDELQIILVHVWDGEDASHSESIRTRFGLEALTFFEDEDRGLAQLVGLPGYPTSLFIDKEGHQHTGTSGQLSYEQIAKVLDAMGVAKTPAAQ